MEILTEMLSRSRLILKTTHFRECLNVDGEEQNGSFKMRKKYFKFLTIYVLTMEAQSFMRFEKKKLLTMAVFPTAFYSILFPKNTFKCLRKIMCKFEFYDTLQHFARNILRQPLKDL